MPEQAQVTQELTFKTDDEKSAALEALQGRDRELGPEDVAEIERIEAAPVTEQPKGDDDPGPAPTAEKPAEAAKAEEVKPVASADEKRNWVINEDLLTQFDEEYQDQEGRTRKTITQKTPEDFVKSYTHAQRRVRYLESKALPDARNEGYTRAKTELGKQIEKLERELEDVRRKPTAPEPVQAQAQQPAASSFVDVIKKLEGVADEDLVDHIPTLAAGLKGAVAALGESASRVQSLEQTIAELKAGKHVEAPVQQAVAPEENTTVKAWQEACKVMDGFVASPECPKELRVNRGFNELASDAMRFHKELASHYTGKTQSELTDSDMSEAVAAYLAGSPQLTNRIHAAGLTEPAEYRKWVELDAVDALRNGWYRDPQSQKWRQRFSSDSGRPVQFPDAGSAYSEYLRITGKAKADVTKAVRDNTAQLVNAITQRDNGLVQMDSSGAQKSSEMGQEQALSRLDEINNAGGSDFVIQQGRRGNRELWNQYNSILVALGQEKLPESLLA